MPVCFGVKNQKGNCLIFLLDEEAGLRADHRAAIFAD